MVAIATGAEEGIPIVDHDHKAFISKALDYLASRGRRRIAILLPGKVPDYEDSFAAGLAARGMVSHPWWTLFFSPVEMQGASSTVHLLMRPGQDERPDGVIIADDNLVEEALAGLMAAGVRIPEDADVVAHANFPCVAKTPVPLKRLGYDCREMLRTCTQIIDAICSGEPVPPRTLIAPVFGECY